ncbi:MAG TPA: transferrin receptor-like dimerization domain-containing protein [Vicinamibacterales bacterium]|nr:transferrin receptor-like dimerization domain-containing protein [Vicinamibacterales bacterium]
MRRYLQRGILAVPVAALCFASAPHTQTRSVIGYGPASGQAELDWEKKIQAIPKPDNIKANLMELAAEPHALGSPRQKQNSLWLQKTLRSYGLDAQIEEFDVLFPTPLERKVELVAPTTFTAKLKEPAVAGDPTSGQSTQLPTYLAYVKDGDVTAPLVYVNNGEVDDYKELDRLGISVKGAIAIARYGSGWRGLKVQLAAEHGAVGCLIYSDPHEDGYFNGDVYPKGAFRPPDGVQRGSAMIMQLAGGDPQTPGWASTPGARRIPIDQAATLQKIPALPLSYADAQPLLAALEGPVAPQSWRGALPITYHIGPGAAKVHLVVKSNYQVVPAYDVIVKMTGSQFPDEWVVRANHYDAWVNGASDPVSGAAAEVEELRAFGELLKQGWRPKRTIVYAFWDGEEPAWLGSSEWAEAHADELFAKTVAYLGSDSTGKGVLNMSGSQSLEHFVNDVAKDIPDTQTPTMSVYQRLEQRAQAAAGNAAGAAGRGGRGGTRDGDDFRLGPLGSGSDYTPFIHHLAIASLSMSYSGDGGAGGVYHSIYDDPTWYLKFSDGDFTYGRTFAQTFNTVAMRLADADVLPLQFTDLSLTLDSYSRDLQTLAKNTPDAPAFDFAPLDRALAGLAQAAKDYDAAFSAASESGAIFRKTDADRSALNLLLLQNERKAIAEDGLPRRPWFKYAFFAPGWYTGYSAKTLPGVREAVEANNWTEAADQEKVLVDVIQRMTSQVQAARAKLQ